MSTMCLIARQTSEDEYRAIYCHSDGYPSYTGAMLVNYCNTPEKVDKLLKLGDLSILKKKLDPDPHYPHNFEERQDDVTVAYGRDRGEKNVGARTLSLQALDDPANWVSYVYIFTMDNRWKYFRYRHSVEGLRDVAADLTRGKTA